MCDIIENYDLNEENSSEESGEDDDESQTGSDSEGDNGDSGEGTEVDDDDDNIEDDEANELEIENNQPNMKESPAKLSGSDNEGETCPICLNHFVGQELGTPENCNHTFCLECILEWSKTLNSCPLDRMEFNEIIVRLLSFGDVIRKIKVKMRPKEAEAALPEDTTACEVCHSGEREDRLLLCDSCDLAYHCECLDPPLWYIPIIEWFCPPCSAILDRTKRRNPRAANYQRVIPRTIASETVRSRIQSQRTTAQRSSSTTSINSPSTSRAKTTSKPKKRRTYRRRRKVITKTTVLARTKKNSGLGKGKTQNRVVVTTSIKRRRRRRKYKKRKVTTTTTRKSRFASKPLAAPTAKERIANQLGLYKSTAGGSIPSVKQTSSKGNKNISTTSTLSLFGNRNQLMDFNEDFSSNVGIAGPSTYSSKTVAKPVQNILPPVDLLSHILCSQDLLQKSSKDIKIGWDGSLTLKKTEDSVKKSTSNFQNNTATSIKQESASHSFNNKKVGFKVEDIQGEKSSSISFASDSTNTTVGDKFIPERHDVKSESAGVNRTDLYDVERNVNTREDVTIKTESPGCFASGPLSKYSESEHSTCVKLIKTEKKLESLTNRNQIKSEPCDKDFKPLKKSDPSIPKTFGNRFPMKSNENEMIHRANFSPASNSRNIKEIGNQVSSRFKPNKKSVVDNTDNDMEILVSNNLEGVTGTNSNGFDNMNMIIEAGVDVKSEYPNGIDMERNSSRKEGECHKHLSNIDNVKEKSRSSSVHLSKFSRHNHVASNEATLNTEMESTQRNLVSTRIESPISDGLHFNEELFTKQQSCDNSTMAASNITIKSEGTDGDKPRKRARPRIGKTNKDDHPPRKKRSNNHNNDAISRSTNNDLYSQFNNIDPENSPSNNDEDETTYQWDLNDIEERDSINTNDSSVSSSNDNFNEINTHFIDESSDTPSMTVCDENHDEPSSSHETSTNGNIQQSRTPKRKAINDSDVEVVAVKVKKAIYIKNENSDSNSSVGDLQDDIKIICEVRHVMEPCSNATPEIVDLTKISQASQNIEKLKAYEIKSSFLQMDTESNPVTVANYRKSHLQEEKFNNIQSKLISGLKKETTSCDQHKPNSIVLSDIDSKINIKNELDVNSPNESDVDIKVESEIAGNDYKTNILHVRNNQVKSEIEEISHSNALEPNSKIKLEFERKIAAEELSCSDMSTSNLKTISSIKHEDHCSSEFPSANSSLSILASPVVISSEISNVNKNCNGKNNEKLKGKDTYLQPPCREVNLKSYKKSSKGNRQDDKNFKKRKIDDEEQKHHKRHKSSSDRRFDQTKKIGVDNKHDLLSCIESAVKKFLKPFFLDEKISKDNYKDIMRRSIPKILKSSANGIIDTNKIKKLIFQYVEMFTKQPKPS